MVIHTDGNLLESGEKVIAHGCNCFHLMGSGIARAIANKWPEVPRVDRAHHKRGDINALGTISLATLEEITVLNLYTQYQPGRSFEYAALRDCIRKLERSKYTDIAIPRIGCGIGGGDWPVVEELLQNTHVNFTVYTYAQEAQQERR